MDYIALLIQCALLCIGIAFIYSTGVQNGGDLADLWGRQIRWSILGFTVYFTIAVLDYRIYCQYSWIFYIFGMLLLIAIFPFGKVVNNAKSWLPMPGFGLMQPSELVKPVVILFLSWLATNRELRYSKIPLWIPVAVAALLPAILIARQPDFGTALVFLPVAASIIFIIGLKKRWITTIFCCVIILTPVIFIHLRPHQQERIKVFIESPASSIMAVIDNRLGEEIKENINRKLNKFLNTKDGKPRDDWNARQARYAVGSGGLTGRGYKHGILHAMGFLPKNVAPSDFIFSVIAEEAGFLGAATVLALLAGLFLCYCHTALLARNTCGCCLALASAILLGTHTIINIGMNVQAVPIIGIPLPFVSYGGSFIISMMAVAGLVQSIHIHRRLPVEIEQKN